MKNTVNFDKDFLMRVLGQVDSLSRRVESLENTPFSYDLFKKMLTRSTDEAIQQIMKMNPNLVITHNHIPPQS